MNRIVLVQAHAMDGSHIERREFIFAKLLQSLGWRVSIFAMSLNLTEIRQRQDRDGIEILFFRVDDARQPSAKRSSTLLIKEAINYQPPVIIFKGLGYSIVEDIILQLTGNTLMGVILGGKWASPLNKRFNFFFVEHPSQITAIKEQYKNTDAWFRLFPKFIAWNTIESFRSLPRKFDLCNVGSFIERKNQVALAPLFDAASIAFVGDGPKRPAIMKLAANKPWVRFYGQVIPSEVIRIVSQSYVMVHSSRWEGLPRAIIEAFSCGTPVVALEKTLAFALSDLPFVILVNEDEIKHVTLKLLADKSRIMEMSQLAIDYAIENHGPDCLFTVATSFHEWLRQINITNLPSCQHR